MKMWNCHFLMILTFTFDIYFTEGLKWITDPLPVNKCKGQTANFNWEYIKELDEEITELHWIFNTTVLIAYSSMHQGFNVMPKYQGRVNQSGETGILLHNISSKDIGNYTLYPLIKWEESPNIQTVWLNVIEAVTKPDCSCAKLSDFPEVRNGETHKITVGSCNLEINSSFCCPEGLENQYCVNDPVKLCTPIRNHTNVTESTTQSRIVTHPAGKNDLSIDLLKQMNTINWVLGISIVCMLVMFITLGMVLRVFCLIHMNYKKLNTTTVSEDKRKKIISGASLLEDKHDNEESLSLEMQDVNHDMNLKEEMF
ncbi:hypothetical protein ACJMK2_026120 [Sinanodonta woodiana]|uniref:Uncharacterized protein n=1 Tax=Sinanodonta woodiana TaxID=1069815 RepID=A0ABD3XIL4_SINWO